MTICPKQMACHSRTSKTGVLHLSLGEKGTFETHVNFIQVNNKRKPGQKNLKNSKNKVEK